ncbi:hypothetical protein [Halopseudomonas sabulinigri]|uniref:Uncharacterized protein n=1 Tax=Halopseudomonas sabulinigri TaxID=472181 RepID=A0ABP9ZRV7_9GAMM
MKKVIISKDNIAWPNKCVYCGDVASTEVTLKSKAVQKVGYFVLFVLTTSRIIKIIFPVCKAHKRKAYIASKLSQRNGFNLTLGVLSVFALSGPAGDIYRLVNELPQPEFSLGWRLFMYGFPALYWSLFFWAKSQAPVVIQDLKGEVSFHFKNVAYGEEFEAINS